MKRIPYSDPCVNGSSVPARSSTGCAESSIERSVNLSLSAANRRLAALRQQHGANVTATSRNPIAAYATAECASDHAEKAETSHTVDGWLAPLHEIIQQNRQIESKISAADCASSSDERSQTFAGPTDLPRTLRNNNDDGPPTGAWISPQILSGLLRSDEVATGRVWLLARALDKDGRGWIDVKTLRERFTGKGAWHICGWRRLRQILAAGHDRFWKRDDRGRLWLVGQAQVAARLGVEHIARATVELSFDVLIKNVGAVRAAFFAAQHTRGDAPISRAALTEITAVPERTQRHYDVVTATEKQINWGLGAPHTAENFQEHVYQYGGAAFIFKDKKGQRRLARQLPNSYRCPFRVIDRPKKRLNRQLQDLVNQGRRGNVQFERRYFADGRSLADSKAMLGFVQDRQIGGRTIWIFFGA